MELPACRARAIAGDDRPHTRGAGALYQELGTEVRRFACDSSVLDRPAGRRNAMRSQSHGPGVREEC